MSFTTHHNYETELILPKLGYGLLDRIYLTCFLDSEKVSLQAGGT
jgi:hypothetical protein